MNEPPPCIVWFRQDLRLNDNPALAAALDRGAPVAPVYIWAPEEEGAWPPGAASRWWLHQSLKRLSAVLEERGSRLILRRGPTEQALASLRTETGADAIFWNRRYEPAAIARDGALKTKLRSVGIRVESFNGSLLFEPTRIRNTVGEPFRVFTPFWRTCMQEQPAALTGKAPKRIAPLKAWPQSVALEHLKLEPAIDWAEGLRDSWQPGEDGAREQLRRFRRHSLDRYASDRDRPDLSGTSRLSPHLHFGEIGPGELWRAIFTLFGDDPSACESYLRQLIWREFAYHLLYHFPSTPQEPMRKEFSKFPWHMRREWLEAWQRGKTGYPLVDAGMRELWHTGWMHNRVRLVTASFLVKHLLIPWQEGAKWFWDTLVDADLANNTMNWQWVAGCGADAAPYFRIFNPALQASKFDPMGDYVKRWVPEAGTPAYPAPIIDHSQARARALRAWESMGGKHSIAAGGVKRR